VFGTARDLVLSGGGVDFVYQGGVATGTVISSGSMEYVYGSAVGEIVRSGGVANVYSGGTASGATVASGGTEYIQQGGILAGATLSGGLIEIMSGGTAGTSQIGFATSAGGTLRLDDSQHFNGVISGFGVPGSIDLRDIAFGSGTTLGYTDNGGSGTLTVQAGSNMATIHLIGQYVQANFNMQTDGHGGTLITDPPLAGQYSYYSPTHS
jgi:autotransporter passenger strand-loop-strand repeat protein